MSKAAGGLREHRRRDVMDLLARARPASLDPPAAAPSAEQMTARVMAAAEAPSAYAGPPRAGRAPWPGWPPRASRPPRARRAVLAGTGLTVTAGAAAIAVLMATAGSGAPPSGMITAAMVRRVATASRSALAASGQAVVAYRTSQGGVLQDSGTDSITFSGKNWNDAFSQTIPNGNGQPAHTQFAINRIVNGQFYLYIAGRTPKLEWYHDTNPTGHPSFTIPDPRTVLRALEPSARFEAAGYQVIGGMRLKKLRATDPGRVTGLGSLPDLGPGGRVTSLAVWVDGHGVVRRMVLTSVQTSMVYPFRAYNARRKANGTMIITVPSKVMAAHLRAKLKKARSAGGRRFIIRVAPAGSGTARREVAVTTLTVSFSHIGQPQRITPPRHAIQQFGRG
jgi:hypothetical protein